MFHRCKKLTFFLLLCALSHGAFASNKEDDYDPMIIKRAETLAKQENWDSYTIDELHLLNRHGFGDRIPENVREKVLNQLKDKYMNFTTPARDQFLFELKLCTQAIEEAIQVYKECKIQTKARPSSTEPVCSLEDMYKIRENYVELGSLIREIKDNLDLIPKTAIPQAQVNIKRLSATHEHMWQHFVRHMDGLTLDKINIEK